MKILYLSCHSVLERDEVSMFHKMGHEIFSPGAFVEPANPGDASLRPGIPGLVYDAEILKQFHEICGRHPGEDAKDHLTKEFVDNFDCVIVMHLPRWIQRNWEAMKHKRVIWRTIGQSVASTEDQIRPYRNQGLEIVRYSPQEVYIPGFAGQDAMIRFGKDPADYGPWNGSKERVVSFSQSMKQRGDACGYRVFEPATRPFNRALFGPGNDSEPWMHGKVSFEQLRNEMCDNRVYFYTGTHPASYTLNFIEAWMSGMPIVAIGNQYGNADWCRNHQLYEIPYLINSSFDGFITDDLGQMHMYIKMLLDNPGVASFISQNARASAIKHFGIEHISLAWKDYLNKGRQQ